MESTELMHYGVKGMKWGVRKARQEYGKLDTLKGQYKHAKKAYNRSFNYAQNNSPKSSRISRVKRAENDARWEDVTRDKARLKTAKADYKAQKKAVRANAPIAAKLERGAKAVAKGMGVVGGLYITDQVYYGGAGAKFAKSATKKAYDTLIDKTFQYSILDASGKVLRRYN